MQPKNWKIWTKNEGMAPPPHIICDISTIPFREELEWKAKEARLRRTWLGKLKEFIFTTGILSFL